MTFLRRHWEAVPFLLLGVVWSGFALIDGRIASALMAVAWLAVGVLRFFGVGDARRKRMQEQRRLRVEAKYAGRPMPPQPDDPPRWFSPDNPPGWYLNPATNEPAYWSELGWRGPPPA